MSEEYHPVVEAKMVTDRSSEDFGRVEDQEMAHDIANEVDQKVSQEKSGDFYAEDIEKASDKITAMKIGEVVAKNSGYSLEQAKNISADMIADDGKDVYGDFSDADKDMVAAMGSSLKLGADAYRQKRDEARQAKRAA